MLVMLFMAHYALTGRVHEVHHSNTDSAIAVLYILLDSSEDALCSV